jgi:hypothetical protein
MSNEKMIRESNSSSDYKPYINGHPGFMTEIEVKNPNLNHAIIKGEILIRIPVLFDIIKIEKGDFGIEKEINGTKYKLIQAKDNCYVLESTGFDNDNKILPLTSDNKEYSSVKKVTIPYDLYTEFIKNPEMDEEQIAELAQTIVIDKSHMILLGEISGNFNKIYIYKVIKFQELRIPIEIQNK